MRYVKILKGTYQVYLVDYEYNARDEGGERLCQMK